MPGNWCSVAVCQNNSTRQPHLVFFSFPRDAQLCKQWLKLCRRNTPVNVRTAKLCSAHFAEDDYDDLFKAKFTNTIPRKLKQGAVPSVNLEMVTEKKTPPRPSAYLAQKIAQEKQRKSLVNDFIQDSSLSIEETIPVCVSDYCNTVYDTERTVCITLEEKLAFEQQIQYLTKRNAELLTETKELKTLLLNETREKLMLAKELEKLKSQTVNMTVDFESESNSEMESNDIGIKEENCDSNYENEPCLSSDIIIKEERCDSNCEIDPFLTSNEIRIKEECSEDL